MGFTFKTTPEPLQTSFGNACVNIMRTDPVFHQIKNDKLILLFSQILYERLGKRRANDISPIMRQLSRLKIQLHEQVEDGKELLHYIDPPYFSILSREIAGFFTSTEGISIFSRRTR